MIQKPFTILNASAGSGKTYSLVKSYIKILLAENEPPSLFSEIIAMTFTNKASLEMKKRIVEKLDELSNPTLYGQKSEQFAQELSEELSIPSAEIHTRSKKLLTGILHRYEEFYVMTIDKFNLRLIRSFSLDLDLPNDFEIILNEDKTIEQVVDNLIGELGKNKALTTLIFKYAKSMLDEDKKWDFRKNLIDFAKMLKQEKNFGIVEQLQQTSFTLKHYEELRKELKQLNDGFIEKCKEFITHFDPDTIDPKTIFNGNTTLNQYRKIKNYSSLKVELFTPIFIENCTNGKFEGKNFPEGLIERSLKLDNEHSKVLETFEIYSSFLKNYFNMALLKYISEALVELRLDERLIRISEFNKMISELVAQDDAPFIYERLGTKFRHFMLDEFQDTSRLQWLNMIPLIHESLGNNNQNLIVGDPKQSIYRFKNGVAEQFVELPKLYNPENNTKITQRSEFFEKMGTVSDLKSNWRSAETIVNFNNQLFELIRSDIPLEQQKFYHSVSQQPESSKNGFISIHSTQVTKAIQPADSFPFILNAIQESEAAGFKRGEICILGIKNKECSEWANLLNNLNYKVVSVDSLSVENDQKVRFIICYLKLRLNQNSQNENKQFAEQYCRIKNLNIDYYQSFFENYTNSKGTISSFFNAQKFVNQHFGSVNDLFFSYESLYELIQKCFEKFGFKELNNPFLHHLADMIHSFELKNGPDLKLFLDDFASNDSGKAVQIPESDDAIKVMTLHKSKGLEFPVVILPTLNSKFDKFRSPYFVQTPEFLLYTNLTKTSSIKEVVSMREEEVNQQKMDAINLFYVGMTRPVERLYIYNKSVKESFGDIFHSALLKINPSFQQSASIDWQIGDEKRSEVKDEKIKDAFYTPLISEDNLWFPEIALQDKEELLNEKAMSEEQRFGSQFHFAISQINAEQEIEKTISGLIKEGLIESEFETKIIHSLHTLFQSTEYTKLIANATKILNEQSLIVSKNEQLRPDKIIFKPTNTIVVDYKTGIPSKKDIAQVRMYKKVLTEIGYPNVEGCIFYTNENRLQEVE